MAREGEGRERVGKGDEWGKRMRGTGPYAHQIKRRFDLATKRLGLNLDRQPLRTDLFTPPLGSGVQLSLL